MFQNTNTIEKLKALSLDVVNRWDDDTLIMLYGHFYKALVVYASTLIGTTEGAEDIVQDTCAKIWEKQPKFESISQIKVYLYTTIHNYCISHIRKTSKQGNVIKIHNMNDDMLTLSDNGEEDPFGPEVYRKLMLMLEELPARQREVFIMAMEGKKNAEIAEQLQISQNTVKVLKGRALQRLKRDASENYTLFLLFLLLS